MPLDPWEFPIRTIFTIEFTYTISLGSFEKSLLSESTLLKDEQHGLKKKLLNCEDTVILEKYEKVVQFGRAKKSPILLLYIPPESKGVTYCIDMFSNYNDFRHDIEKVNKLLEACAGSRIGKWIGKKDYEMLGLDVWLGNIRLKEKTWRYALRENLSGFLWCLIPAIVSLSFESVQTTAAIFCGILLAYLLISFLDPRRNKYALEI